jgi:mannose-1-phosphate guanylyltransferase
MLSVLLLCGGKNSRIQKYKKQIVKPLIKFRKKTLLEHNLNLISKLNITTKIYINVSKDFKRFQKLKKINKFTIIREKKIQGTAGVLLQNIEKFNNEILIIYADNYLDISIKKFYAFFKSKNIKFLIGVFNKKDLGSSGLITIKKNNQVLKIEEKVIDNKNITGLCNAGIYLIQKSCLLKFAKLNIFADFAKDIIPNLIKSNLVFAKRIRSCFSFDDKYNYLKSMKKYSKRV